MFQCLLTRPSPCLRAAYARGLGVIGFVSSEKGLRVRSQEEQRQKKEADGRQREVAQRAAREKEAAKEVGPAAAPRDFPCRVYSLRRTSGHADVTDELGGCCPRGRHLPDQSVFALLECPGVLLEDTYADCSMQIVPASRDTVSVDSLSCSCL